MLEVHPSAKEWFEQTVEFAKKIGLYERPKKSSDDNQYLKERLDYLEHYATRTDTGEDITRTKCVLRRDLAPASFEFTMYRRVGDAYEPWFIGGLIYHGAHDGWGSGSAPTFSVTLTPCQGWGIHT